MFRLSLAGGGQGPALLSWLPEGAVKPNLAVTFSLATSKVATIAQIVPMVKSPLGAVVGSVPATLSNDPFT